MGVLKLFESTANLYCVIATIKTPEGSMQKVVDGAAFSVGRAPDCVLSIPDVGISRLHLLVTIKRGDVYINDQGSSNGTFVNGQKIESKRLIPVKPADEVKVGKSDVVIQFACIEKHFKTDHIAESLLPEAEKENLVNLVKASHSKAQEVLAMAQSQAEQLIQVANEKARNTENQTLLMQEDILSKAQVESQQIISETKRKSAQMIFEAEETARSSVQNIHLEADQKRNDADEYYKTKVQEAQTRGDEIIAQHTKMGQELIEDLRQKTIEKAEKEANDKLKEVFQLVNEKTLELDSLRSECDIYRNDKKSEIDAEIRLLKEEFYEKFNSEKQMALDEHHSQIARLEAEFIQKKKDLEAYEVSQNREIEERAQEFTVRLDAEYAEKHKHLEKKYDDRTISIEKEFSSKQNQLEEDFKRRQKELADAYEKNRTDLETQLERQRKSLEKEVEAQRHNLLKVQADLDKHSADHLDLKSKVDDLKETLKVLQRNEEEVTSSVDNKRTSLNSLNVEYENVGQKIRESNSKMKELQVAIEDLKSKYEQDKENLQSEHQAQLQKNKSEIKDLLDQYESEKNRITSDLKRKQKEHDETFARLSADLDAEKNRIQTEVEQHVSKQNEMLTKLKSEYEEESRRLKKEMDQELQKYRAEVNNKIKEQSDLEKIKIEEHRSQLISEKKKMDINFEKTKKDFELKTREMVEFEKKKLEENKKQFLTILNQQRNIVINEVTKAIIKIEKQGDQPLTGQLIGQAVEGVFNSHVAELSLSTHTTNTVESSRKLKAQWLGYGMAATLSFVMAFKFIIQPQINRNVAGTAENAAASVVKVRPKYQRSTSLEMRGSYVESILHTQRYAEVFLDEQLQDKWFKMIASYMFETWRVPEEKTIEVVAISKSLVSSLEARILNLDAEFSQPGIEKMRESEAEALMRMSNVLGTQVKLEAFKRKEKEFFEPYILNQ